MKLKRTKKILACVLMLLGGIGWFSGFFDFPWNDSRSEMPLGHLKGVAVDSLGNIYCGTQFYSRVQKYDPKGHFLFSLRIDAGGGVCRIRVNQNDELEVATARTDRLYRFSPKGVMLEQTNDVDHFFSDFGTEGESQCLGPNNTLYRIRTSMIFPAVVKTLSSREETVVSVPIHKWLVMGPFPAWLFLLTAILLLRSIKSVEKKIEPQ